MNMQTVPESMIEYRKWPENRKYFSLKLKTTYYIVDRYCSTNIFDLANNILSKQDTEHKFHISKFSNSNMHAAGLNIAWSRTKTQRENRIRKTII